MFPKNRDLAVVMFDVLRLNNKWFFMIKIFTTLVIVISIPFLSFGQTNNLINEMEGSWELKAISGGFTGMGEKIQFKTVLEFTGPDQYTIYKNDISVESGTFSIRKGILGSKITLVPAETSFDRVLTKEPKTMNLENNRLILMDPCCDMFTYHFELL